jgi:hypothetical protein
VVQENLFRCGRNTAFLPTVRAHGVLGVRAGLQYAYVSKRFSTLTQRTYTKLLIEPRIPLFSTVLLRLDHVTSVLCPLHFLFSD